jgi:flagellar capping protein FliD
LTDQQLNLTIGIPTLAVLIGILVNVGYFVSINTRINSLETRLDTRINSLENRLDHRISSLESKFDILVGKVVEMDNRIVRLEERLRP